MEMPYSEKVIAAREESLLAWDEIAAALGVKGNIAIAVYNGQRLYNRGIK